MPNIKEYEAPALGLQPSDRGAASFAAVGRRAGAFYSQAAGSIAGAGARLGSGIASAGDAAVAYMDHKQIREGAAHGTELFDALTQSKDAAISAIDRSDPGYATKVDLAVRKWRDEELEPALDKFRDGFSTERSQAWADHFVATTRQHMFTSSAADITQAAGIGLKNDAKITLNTASNIVARDPSAIDSQLDLWDHSYKGMIGSSPIKGIDAARLDSEVYQKGREQIIKSGVFSAIQKSSNPERTADALIAKYPKDINGIEVKQFSAVARQQVRFQSAEDRAVTAEQKRQNTQAFHEAANKFELSTTRENKDGIVEPFSPPNLRQELNKIVNMKDADPGRVAALIKRAEQVGQATDETTKKNLEIRSRTNQARLYGDTLDGKITSKRAYQEAYRNDEITWEAKNRLEKDFDADRSEAGQSIAQARTDFFKRYAATIDPSVGLEGVHSALGMQKVYEAEQAARQWEADLRKRNIDPQEAYRDPKSANFFGNQLSQFRPSLQEIRQYQKQLEGQKGTSNLTGPNKESHVVSVENKPIFRPPADWLYSPSRKQYKDPNGKFYDREGKEVKP